MTSYLLRDFSWPHQQLDVCRKCDRSISQQKDTHFCVCSDLDGSHMERDPFNLGEGQRVQTVKMTAAEGRFSWGFRLVQSCYQLLHITWPKTIRLEWWMIHFECDWRALRADKERVVKKHSEWVGRLAVHCLEQLNNLFVDTCHSVAHLV